MRQSSQIRWREGEGRDTAVPDMRFRSAEYFGIGRIDRDQVADYARRKGWTLAEAERWLAPILAYDP